MLVDNPPNDNACSEAIARAADLTIIMTLPSLFDLRVALTWHELCRRQGAATGMVINGAPPVRLGTESPLVRDARAVLRNAAARAWGGQITRRHAVVECTARGRAVVEVDVEGAAAAEYRQLWAALGRLLRKEA